MVTTEVGPTFRVPGQTPDEEKSLQLVLQASKK
jgi:hypothetical protein